MPAALLMADLRARVELLAERAFDLAELMRVLNRTIQGQCPPNRFISLFCAAVDPASGEVIYCNAGHNRPVVVRAGGRLERLEIGGPVLGVLPEAGYEQGACRLDRGDLCVLFSDGATDAASEQGEEFGEQRLLELLRESCGRPAREVVERAIETLAGWTAGAPPGDDLTLAVARRTA